MKRSEQGELKTVFRRFPGSWQPRIWDHPHLPCLRCGGTEYVTVWVAPYAMQCIYCKLSVCHGKAGWPTLPP